MTSFVYRVCKSFGETTKGTGLQGTFIAVNLAESMLDNNAQSAALGVWVTKNYTATEMMNAMIDRTYLGNKPHGADNAAKLYFNKSVDSLSLSENIVLGALSQKPSLANFCGDGVQLTAQSEELLKQLKANFTGNYKNAKFVAPEYSEAAKASRS